MELQWQALQKVEYSPLQRHGDIQVGVDEAVSKKSKKRRLYQVEKCKRNKSPERYF